MRNLTKVGARAARNWKGLLSLIRWVQADLALDKPLVFPKAKDRPVVITALAARADWLLTLDEGDFHQKLGREVYGLRIATPGGFLMEHRALGLL